MGVEFFSTTELLYPNMKVRLRLITARPIFYTISDNPSVLFGIVVIVQFTLVVLLFLMMITRYEWTCLHILVSSSTVCKHLQRLLSSLQTKPVCSRKHFQQCSRSSDCYCNEHKLCIHWIEDWKCKLVSTILILDSLEYSQEVSQSWT